MARLLQVSLQGESRRKVPKAVRRELQRAGIDERHADALLDPRRHGTGSYADFPPWKGEPPLALIKYLANDLGLNQQEIVQRLHLVAHSAQKTFLKAGIAWEQSKVRSPFAAWNFDVEELWNFTRQGMTAAMMAEHYGVSETLMLRTLHRHHLPVHRPNKREDDMYVRYDELISNNAILDALKMADVPLSGPDPPSRGPLPPELVNELRDRFKLTFFDIELLTGRKVSAAMRDARLLAQVQ